MCSPNLNWALRVSYATVRAAVTGIPALWDGFRIGGFKVYRTVYYWYHKYPYLCTGCAGADEGIDDNVRDLNDAWCRWC
ncbi:Uncharacterised protein [Mycobacteroides abscessus subsp. abscessus]|nr:Uncharacterised protein [Mycobacteroides abscessus subsp. abscessus]